MPGSSEGAWWSFVAALLLYLLAGTQTTIDMYSQEAKAALGMDDASFKAATAFGFVGVLAPLAGLVSDRYGVRTVIALSGAMVSVGYLGFYLATVGLAPQSAAFVGASYFLAMQGTYWCIVAGINLVITAFSDNRGTAIGLLEAFFGLTTGVWTVWNEFFRGPGVALLLGMGMAGAVFSVLALGLARPDSSVGASMRGFWFTLAIVTAMAVVVSASALLGGGAAFATALTAVVLCIFLVPSVAATQASSPSLESEGTATMQELTLWESLWNSTFWGLLLAASVPLGIGYVIIQNMAQIVEALDIPDAQLVTKRAAIFGSVAQGLAAVVTGRLADMTIHSVPRPAWFLASGVLMAIASAVLLLHTTTAVYVGFACCEMSWGMLWSIFAACTSEVTGRSHTGSIFATLDMTFSIVSAALSSGVASAVFAAHSADGVQCFGQGCYRTTFQVLLALCLVVVLPASAWLSFHTKDFYLRVRRLPVEPLTEPLIEPRFRSPLRAAQGDRGPSP